MTNITNNKKTIKRISLFLQKNFSLVVAAVTVINLFAFAAADSVAFANGCGELYDGVLRLHILADSDSEEDQRIKLCVRDSILNKAHELGLGNGCEDMQSLIAQANELLPQLQKAAQEELAKQGSSLNVSAQVTRMYFNTRVYDDFTMPAGEYNAVRFVIGSGEGKNWWCVLFPQICLPAAFSEEEQTGRFSQSQLRVLNSSPKYEPRFALLELIYGKKTTAKSCAEA